MLKIKKVKLNKTSMELLSQERREYIINQKRKLLDMVDSNTKQLNIFNIRVLISIKNIIVATLRARKIYGTLNILNILIKTYQDYIRMKRSIF
jgi:hypothetical protein